MTAHLFLFPLEVLHDLETLLLHETALLDVELFLGLGVDLFGLLVGLLLDEGHHVLDLKSSKANITVELRLISQETELSILKFVFHV